MLFLSVPTFGFTHNLPIQTENGLLLILCILIKGCNTKHTLNTGRERERQRLSSRLRGHTHTFNERNIALAEQL